MRGPGGNVTGLAYPESLDELSGKWIELLTELVPKLSRLAVLTNADNPSHGQRLKDIEAAGRRLRVDVSSVEMRQLDLEKALTSVGQPKASALILLSDPLFTNQRQRLAAFALEKRLPSVYSYRELPEAGGLLSYGPSLAAYFRHAGLYVDKILKGCQACRPPDRAADDVRTGHQRKNRQGARPHDSVIAAAPRGPGPRMMRWRYGPDSGVIGVMGVRAAVVGTMALIGAVVAAPAVESQQPTKVARVGIFVPGSSSGGDQFQLLVKAFRDGLRELGWIEGQTIVVETRWGEGRLDEFPKMASELVALPVDVIVAWGPQTIRAAQQASGTVPIVMAIVHEPVAFSFVKSLARPGGNITGSAFQDSELGTKPLELLKEIVPRLRRVALLWDRGGGGDTGVRTIEAAAQRLGLRTERLEVQRGEDFALAFMSAKKNGAHAVFQVASPFLATHRAKLIELSAAQRPPMACETTLFVVEGCLIAYGPDFPEMSRRAATYVDKILKGAKPADLPVEQPTKFELAINAKTAQALGLTISKLLRQRADKVVE